MADDKAAVPLWLTVVYFEEILTKKVNNFVKIVKYDVTAATGAAQNYGSIVYHVAITYELRDGSSSKCQLLLKSMPETESLLEFMKFLGQFPKEKLIYDTLLHQITEVYATAVGRRVKFGPNCVHTEETPTRITLILEDVQELGYKHVASSSGGGLDMPHMKAALQKLAQFHAASVVHQRQYGVYDEQFYVGLVSERSRKFFEQRSAAMLNSFTSAMAHWELTPDDYVKCRDMLPSSQQFVDQLIGLSHEDPSTFNVLNHGDCWRDNIMFQHDADGAIAETLFVNFQLCKYGPPSYDLYLLIFTSALLDIQMARFDEFLEIYQRELATSLATLKFSQGIPTITDVQQIMERDRFYALFVVISYLPVILMPSEADSKTINDQRLAGGAQAQSARQRSMLNPRYALEMRNLLPWLYRRGFLDH